MDTESAVGTTPSPPEPGVGPDVLVARARALAPKLVERQADTERRTFYAPDIHEEFLRAGFYRILVPRRFGGYQCGVETFLRVTMELARACPSTGWMYCLGAAHALPAASLFDAAAQAEIFAGGDFTCPATITPGGSAERLDDGHWRISGTWRYCSGSPYATHFMAHVMVPDQDGGQAPMLFIAPRDRWRRLDDWGQQLGLRGSGSHGITLRDARIPDRFTLPGTHMSEADASSAPGRYLHDDPEYGGAQFSFMLLEVAALAVGMARGALDAYADLMRTRPVMLMPSVRRADDPDHQLWYGEAAGMVATAEAAVLNAVQQWSGLCARPPADFTRARDLAIAAICREAIRLCWSAVEGRLFPTAGSSAVRHGERIERIWRDLSTLHSHAGVGVLLAAVTPRELARALVKAPAEGQS
ncbi:acyl-CoA dehydrogenase family protein [Streptomyces sp. NPDC017529]|uniref:acyl-CoA dehydrogenase family protein n=1 Tax=Streptomyces sp. NPDC017529 TaxID=3365000 RepID=UPI0037B162EC